MTDASEHEAGPDHRRPRGGSGKALAEHLEARYRLRLLYHRTIPEAHAGAAAAPASAGPRPRWRGRPTRWPWAT